MNMFTGLKEDINSCLRKRMKRQLNQIMKTIQDMRNGLSLSSWSGSYIGSPTEGYRRVCLRMSWTTFFPEIWPAFAIPFFQRFKNRPKIYHPKPDSYTENPPPVTSAASPGLSTGFCWNGNTSDSEKLQDPGPTAL